MNLRKLPAHPGFLPRLMLVDAVATGATAVLLILGAELLAPMLQLPVGLLRGAGLLLVPFVGLVYGLSRQAAPARAAVAAVVAINFAWVVASAWVAFGGPWQPNLFGIGFVMAQALVVLAFADLGWFGLRATRMAHA